MRTVILLIQWMDWMPEWRPDCSRSLSNVLEWCSGKDIHWNSRSSNKVRSSEPAHQISFNEDKQRTARLQSKGKSIGHNDNYVNVTVRVHHWCFEVQLPFNGKLLEVNDLKQKHYVLYAVRDSINLIFLILLKCQISGWSTLNAENRSRNLIERQPLSISLRKRSCYELWNTTILSLIKTFHPVSDGLHLTRSVVEQSEEIIHIFRIMTPSRPSLPDRKKYFWATEWTELTWSLLVWESSRLYALPLDCFTVFA